MAKDMRNGDRILHGPWTPEDSSRMYGIPDWGQGFFGVNEAGHMTVRPHKTADFSVEQ